MNGSKQRISLVLYLKRLHYARRKLLWGVEGFDWLLLFHHANKEKIRLLKPVAFTYFRHYRLPEDHFSWDLIKISALYKRHVCHTTVFSVLTAWKHLAVRVLRPYQPVKCYEDTRLMNNKRLCQMLPASFPSLLLNGTLCLVLQVTDIKNK